jgi:cyclopropane fatty-acyl-phospholipid synthase-like methyltransferase
MKLASDSTRDYRLLVRDGYDACAPAFNAARALEQHEAPDLLDALPAGSRVLDLGCGGGAPVARTLARRHRVVGVDLSAGQLALARRQAPGVALLLADMGSVAFAPASFDAVVSFYAIFHLPRELQPALFARIHGWLRPGGLLLVSLGRTDEPPYTEDFFGVEMYWSHYGTARYRQLLRDAGFTIVEERTLAHGYREDGSPPTEAHPLFFARR